VASRGATSFLFVETPGPSQYRRDMAETADTPTAPMPSRAALSALAQ
jgi:hypothetical protein